MIVSKILKATKRIGRWGFPVLKKIRGIYDGIIFYIWRKISKQKTMNILQMRRFLLGAVQKLLNKKNMDEVYTVLHVGCDTFF